MSKINIINYSPNFYSKKRILSQIKFLVFHYTGMKNENDTIKRLTNIQSEVSTHYLIKTDGKVILMVPDSYIAWHAGISYWGKYKFINKYSIGIEISNPGHSNNYKKFTNRQIKSIIILAKYLIKKYKIKNTNVVGHSDIAPDRKKDPGEKFPWKYLSKNKIGIWHNLNLKKLKKERKLKISNSEKNKFFKNLFKIGYSKKIIGNLNNFSKLTIAFQRRYRQDLINGKIDKECLLISENLVKIINKLS